MAVVNNITFFSITFSYIFLLCRVKRFLKQDFWVSHYLFIKQSIFYFLLTLVRKGPPFLFDTQENLFCMLRLHLNQLKDFVVANEASAW